MHTATARKGRERTCNQCGATYRSIRSTSLYCSTPCRKKAGRGKAPTGGPKAGPGAWSIVGQLLVRARYVGPVSPVSRRDASSTVYGLTVEAGFAYAELARLFDERGWGVLSRAEFDASLKADGIQGYSTRSPEAAENKQWKDRQRQRINRTA